MRPLFQSHLALTAAPGSNKASSYLRALDLLGPILAQSKGPFARVTDLWRETSPALIQELYRYVSDQQRLGDGGIFDSAHSPSYWRSGFYSAALRAYAQFLIQHHYESQLLAASEVQHASGEEVAEVLEKIPLEHEELLLEEDDDSKQGKDILRQIKTRLNQGVFRGMILRNYGGCCAVSGLNLPDVLRASHISAWSQDEKNRLNPCNGICLSATYDAAFDRHLISFDEDYRLICSKALRDQCGSNAAFQQVFKKYEGSRLLFPKQHQPEQLLLSKHREKMPV